MFHFASVVCPFVHRVDYRPIAGGVCIIDNTRQITTKTPNPPITSMIPTIPSSSLHVGAVQFHGRYVERSCSPELSERGRADARTSRPIRNSAAGALVVFAVQARPDV
jgi:hypothetical protein